MTLLRTAHKSLVEAAWLSEKLEYHALEGEVLTVIAGLETVIGQPRREPGARRIYGEQKFS